MNDDLDNEFGKEAFKRFEQMFQSGEYDSSYCAKHRADILHYASSCDNWDLIKWIVSKEDDIRVFQNLLFIAVKEGRVDIVQWLVARGANVNAKDSDGKTALQLARENEDEQCVQWLLKHIEAGKKNEKFDFTNFQGKRDVILVKINNHRDLSDILFDPDNSQFVDHSAKDSDDEE